ncbi:MAG: hypothetical protein IJ387_02310 [Thermoguttaceae bacterium]|nr:hypothetical protein [Thermoguttaceae bacterium]
MDLPQNFLFRFAFPCRRLDAATESAAFGDASLNAEALSAEYRLPFWTLSEIVSGLGRGREPGPATPRSPENADWFDFRIAWSPRGLVVTTVVAGRRRVVRRTPTESDAPDALRLCLDTRDVKEARRAGRFCHKLLLYPFVGKTDDAERPRAIWAPIARAKESPSPVDVGEFRLASERRVDGFALSAAIPASTLTGFDPTDFRRLGLHFSQRDEERGSFDLQLGEPFPTEDDPSIWTSLEFVE